MTFLFNIVKFIGFTFYIVAILGIIRGLCTYDTFKDKKEWKNTLGVFSAVILAPIIGFLIRDYANSQQKLIHFNDVLEREISKNNGNDFSFQSIAWAFSNLKDSHKEEIIGSLYERFYENNLSSKCSFLNEYGEENLNFVSQIREEVESDLFEIYTAIERQGSNDWWKISKIVPIKDFIKHAPKEIIDKEFSRWESDDFAWDRVLSLDSLSLSEVYLERYPNGKYESNAKKIILDDSYRRNSHLYHSKITSNFTGSSTISVSNRSSYPVTFYYSGNFAHGTFEIDGNSRREFHLPNGYYSISINSKKHHSKGIYENITCSGGYFPYDVQLVSDY